VNEPTVGPPPGERDTWFAAPWDSPPYPAFPFEFRDVSVLSVVYRTDQDAIRRLLPAPLRSTSDLVVFHVYNMRDVNWAGQINEANVMVGAEFDGVEGGYSPILFIDSESGLTHGREVHGQPKRLASVETRLDQDLVVATIRRNGIDVATLTSSYKRERADLAELKDYFDFELNINLKLIPHITGQPAVRQLTARRLTDLRVHECWRGPATVELRPHATVPLHRLPVVETLAGYLWRADFTLVEGTVLHDYLEEGTGTPTPTGEPGTPLLVPPPRVQADRQRSSTSRGAASS